MSFFIPAAHAQASSQAGGGDMFQFVFLIGLFLIFYFIAIRPQRKRQKEHAEMVSGLAKGDEVMTSAGMLGRVTRLDDHYVVLKVADNVELKFQRMSVQAVLPKGTIKQVGGVED